MRLLWLNMALVSVTAAGCFNTHGNELDAGGGDSGGGDAGSDVGPMDTGTPPPPVDAGPGCSFITPSVESLTCPSTAYEGEVVAVSLSLLHWGCCGGGEVVTDVASDGRNHHIQSQMQICDCCDECDCIGPMGEVTVVLGPLSAGSHAVTAGDLSCEIRVLGDASCREEPVDEVRMARVLFPDQQLTVSVIATDVSGCGCTGVGSASEEGIALRACGCCFDCMCIDAGYESSSSGPAPPVGEYGIPVEGLMARPLSVVPRGSCDDSTDIFELRVEAPRPFASSPALHWAVIVGQEETCCTEPRYAIDSERFGNTFELRVQDCTPPVDCACVPPGPTRFESWHPLGELSPGSYTLAVDGVAQPFEVP